MLLVMLAALLLIWDGVLSRLDGLLLLAGMTMLVLWTIHLARSARPDDPLEAEFAAEMPVAESGEHIGWLLVAVFAAYQVGIFLAPTNDFPPTTLVDQCYSFSH